MPAGESGLHRLSGFSTWLERRWLILAIALMVAGICLGALYRPDLQRLDGDDSIQIYLAQRVLEGSPPYVAGLYAKTPATPLLTAAAMMVGRAAGLSDVLSGRLLFVALGGLCVLAMALAGTAIFAGRSRSRGATAALGGLAAAATLLSFRVLFVFAAKGMEPKLILAAFGYLSLWLTARRRWGWAGTCAALAFLAWQPAGLFMAAVLLAALCQAGEPRLRALGRVALGMCVPLAAVGGYLGATGAMAAAWRQAGLGALTFGRAAVEGGNLLQRLMSNPMTIVALTATSFHLARPVFLAGLLGWVGLGVVEPLRVSLSARAESNWAGRLWDALRRPTQLPVLVVGAGFLAFSALDFQGGPDFLPLMPLAGLGIGWWLATLSDVAIGRRWWAATPVIGLAVCAGLVGLGGLHYAQSPVRARALQTQIEAAETLYEIVGEDAEVQFFNCLGPLVFYRRANATRFLHLGSKSLNLMTREGGAMGDLAALIEAQKMPAVVFDGGRYGDAPLQALIAEHYAPANLRLSGCLGATSTEVWRRTAP